MENQINFFTIQDVFDEIDKGQVIDQTKVYDPLHFWEDYGDKYFKSFKRMQDIQINLSWVVQILTSLKPESLLDVGCGFGRLEPFFIDAGVVDKVTGVDFSQKQLDSAVEYLKTYPKREKITLSKASAKNLPFKDKSFDIVLTSELFTHVPPNKVRNAFISLSRVAKKYIVCVERFVFPGEHPYPHIWTHDYVKQVGDWGITILQMKMIGNGMVGMILQP